MQNEDARTYIHTGEEVIYPHHNLHVATVRLSLCVVMRPGEWTTMFRPCFIHPKRPFYQYDSLRNAFQLDLKVEMAEAAADGESFTAHCSPVAYLEFWVTWAPGGLSGPTTSKVVWRYAPLAPWNCKHFTCSEVRSGAFWGYTFG